MKIPLQSVDFEEGGFTSVAKFFSKRWPGGKLKLSEAQAILARVMGYENYNEARHSVGNPGQSSVSADDAKKAMLEALNKEVTADGHSDGDLFDFLPFNYLMFFKENSPLEPANGNTRRL
jgi:hypothetical protein